MTHLKQKYVLAALIIGACSGLSGLSGIASAQAQERPKPTALDTLGGNRQPIKIDADRLDVFDKESKAVFAGNVVAVQGDSTVKCSNLEVYYEQQNKTGQADGAPKERSATPLPSDSAIRRIECAGPVTIVSKTQVATGDHATFDRVNNRVLLTGNVALNDGPNVTKGQRIVYDLKTGVAKVEGAGTRVRTMIVPGSKEGQ